MEEISIHTPTINLDQFLKWAGILQTGGQIKPMIDDGMVKVNGIIINERRKRLTPGDVIEIEGLGKWAVTAE